MFDRLLGVPDDVLGLEWWMGRKGGEVLAMIL